MVNYYRICVSLNGRYLFATEQDHLTLQDDAMKVYYLFLERFPASEGYHVEIMYWCAKGFTPEWGESV